MSFWSDACLYARNRPPNAKYDSAYSSCSVTVSCTRLPHRNRASCPLFAVAVTRR